MLLPVIATIALMLATDWLFYDGFLDKFIDVFLKRAKSNHFNDPIL